VRARENWHQWLFRLITFGFVDWANSPRMLQMEIHEPWRYRLLIWPLFAILIGAYATFALWLGGVIRF
jgi:hypothetical protein